MEFDKGEICRNYRYAKNKVEQVQILAELNAVERKTVIDILTAAGEKVRIPIEGRTKKTSVQKMTDRQYAKAVTRRLEILEDKIRPLEREYKELVAVLGCCGGQKQERGMYEQRITEKEKAKLAGAVKIRTQSQMHQMAFGVRTGYLSYLTVVLMVLRKQYRFSEKKLKEFMDLMQDHINSFYLGLFADDDLIEVLSDEIGYQMKK